MDFQHNSKINKGSIKRINKEREVYGTGICQPPETQRNPPWTLQKKREKSELVFSGLIVFYFYALTNWYMNWSFANACSPDYTKMGKFYNGT